MADYEFRYAPLTGRLTGKQMIEQTEQAINHLASQVDSAAGQVEIISTLANEANENAATALETAEEALATTGRTYITVSTQTDANSYYDSQLIYIADSTSTNIPVADTGMLEVKTNDNKTACEQVFISDSSGDAYYRSGAITAETVGDVTTYTVTWGGWSSRPASQQYVQEELVNYLPLSGGTVTGGLTVEGTITGNLAGSATKATNDANDNPIAGTYLPLAGGTMTGSIAFSTNNGDYSINGDEYNIDIGWNYNDRDGALFGLRNSANPTASGQFQIMARNQTDYSALVGTPAGSLTWLSKEVERVYTSGTNYIRYESGLQLCWNNANGGTTSSGVSVAYPVPFSQNPIVQVTPAGVTNTLNHVSVQIESIGTSSFVVKTSTGTVWSAFMVRWFAIGWWK